MKFRLLAAMAMMACCTFAMVGCEAEEEQSLDEILEEMEEELEQIEEEMEEDLEKIDKEMQEEIDSAEF